MTERLRMDFIGAERNIVVTSLREIAVHLDEIFKALVEEKWTLLKQLHLFGISTITLEEEESPNENVTPYEKYLITENLLKHYDNYVLEVLLPLRLRYDFYFQEKQVSGIYKYVLMRLKIIINLIQVKGKIRRGNWSEVGPEIEEMFKYI